MITGVSSKLSLTSNRETMLENRKKFLFIMGLNCPYPGAGWNRISYLAKYFKEHGIDCEILAPFDPKTIHNMGVTESRSIRIYNVIPWVFIDNPATLIFDNLLAFIYSLPFIIAKEPDIIIISIAPAHQLFSTSWVSKLLNKKLVIDIRDEVDEGWVTSNKKPAFFYKVMQKIFPRIYSDACLVCPTTQGVANNLKQRGVPDSQIHIVPDGVDTTIFKKLNKDEMKQRLNIPNDKFVILFLGQVYSAYRVDIIIDALSLLKQKKPDKYVFLMVGGGLVKTVLSYSRKLGVSDMVKYAGIISDQQELVRIINAADIGVIPYYTDTGLKRMYPTKLFEYSACGLPVIATYWEDSLLVEYIKKYKLGIYVPPGDAKSLAQAIETIEANYSSQAPLYSDACLNFANSNDKTKIARSLMDRLLKESE